jgi:hypothetical protein
MASIREHGLYRNVVIAKDGTILAGHGVVLAVKKLKLSRIKVIRLPIDPTDPRALKILAGDNEIAHLAVIDDRVLTELLKGLNDKDDLNGTGYDPQMLAALVMVTRPASEIADFDAAAEWVGMPEFEAAPKALKMIVAFRDEKDRAAFAKLLGIEVTDKTKGIWWPHKPKQDLASSRFEG